jgi:hypothetical protein
LNGEGFFLLTGDFLLTFLTGIDDSEEIDDDDEDDDEEEDDFDWK